MSTAQLLEKIERLPPHLQQEVEAFVLQKEAQTTPQPEGPYGVKLGLLKDVPFRMSDDFDAPLDDFKDYM